MSDKLPKAEAETLTLTASATDFHMIQGLLVFAAEKGTHLVEEQADKNRCSALCDAIGRVLRPPEGP